MTIEEELTGGHPNSLGNTVAVVEGIVRGERSLDELFACYKSSDEVVRLRTSNAVKRICKERPEMIAPYIEYMLHDIAALDQPSAQWTLANLFQMLKGRMSDEQRAAAEAIMKKNIAEHDDWIVLNMTLKTLGEWAKEKRNLSLWLQPHLTRLANDSRKSVARSAAKIEQQLAEHHHTR